MLVARYPQPRATCQLGKFWWHVQLPWGSLRFGDHNYCFSHNSKCAIQMMIRMMVFWTVCTPNHIAIRNLKCAIQITHFGVHTVHYYRLSNFNSKCAFRIKIQITHFAVVWKQSMIGGGGGGGIYFQRPPFLFQSP